ncbi:aminotransferase class I/II-fold pyridoxal phosphate-dependent enzyme [Desulfobacterales bacterium HSG2]|nr:aminotransferase class I/II-fold pyridoxal phosphate-dependent enzyme [Desulfobacterales bacterium HSG2]
MNPVAQELNAVIKNGNPHLMEMFSKTGRRLYFPKGILSQTAEARQKAYDKFNATIGIATEGLHTMCLPSVTSYVSNIRPSDSLTYAPSFGIFALRHEWREAMIEKNPSLKGKSISLPVVTNGITHGISVFSDMFVDPDDVLVFPDKMWGNNHLIMSVRGDAHISNYAMFSEDGGFNLAAFESKVRQEAENNYKVIVFLNFPNNPTGYTISDEEGDRIVEILTKVAEEGTNIIAVTDDAYFGLCYEDEPIKESLFARMCNLHPRLLAVKLDGATKELFVWGLRVGFITYGTVINGDHALFYEALEKKTAGNIRGTVSNASHLGQSIVLKSMKSPNVRKERAEKVEIMRKRAMRLKEVLANPKYGDVWEMYPFNSGYFMCLRLKTVDAEALRLHLLDEYKVGVISIGETDLRIAFSSVDEENIEALFEFVYKAVKDIEA